MAREGTVKLDDGRALGYAEYGDPMANPFSSFTGCQAAGSTTSTTTP
jgi:hypothetical protein